MYVCITHICEHNVAIPATGADTCAGAAATTTFAASAVKCFCCSSCCRCCFRSCVIYFKAHFFLFLSISTRIVMLVLLQPSWFLNLVLVLPSLSASAVDWCDLGRCVTCSRASGKRWGMSERFRFMVYGRFGTQLLGHPPWHSTMVSLRFGKHDAWIDQKPSTSKMYTRNWHHKHWSTTVPP